MKTKQDLINKIVEIQRWCVENNSETFAIFCNFSGHVNQLELRVYEDGYHKNLEPIHIENIYIREPCDDEEKDGFYDWFISGADNALVELKKLHAKSIKRNKPENLKALKQKQLKELKAKRKMEEEQLEMEINQL